MHAYSESAQTWITQFYLRITSRLPDLPDGKSSISSSIILRYGDHAGNTIEENSIVFSLIRMR